MGSLRDELLIPFRGLPRDVWRGSPVLLGHVGRGLRYAVRAAFHATSSATAPAPAPAAAAPAKSTAQAPAADEPAEGEEQCPANEETALAQETHAGPPWRRRKAGEAKASGNPPAKAAAPAAAPAAESLGDRAERLAVGFLILAVAAVALRMLGGYVLQLLAPYGPAVALVLIIAWCITAAILAPHEEPDEDVEQPEEDVEEATTLKKNDLENSAGERPAEVDPWPAQRELIRAKVEAVAAAGAAGHRYAKGRGVPVDDLLSEFWPKGAPEGIDRKAVIELLTRAGITVRPQMKFTIGGKQKTPPGVHVVDLAKDLGHAPRLPARLVPDLTPEPGPSREAPSPG